MDLGKGGRFVVGRLMEWLYDLTISARGHLPYPLKNVRLRADKSTNVGTLVLERGFGLRIRLVDANGLTCEGLRVTAVRLPDIICRTGKPDATGRLAVRRMPAGDYRLVATDEGRPTTDLGMVRLGVEAESEIERIVTPGGSISLLVRDGGGESVPDMEVDVRADTDPPFERVLVTGLGEVRSWLGIRNLGRSRELPGVCS